MDNVWLVITVKVELDQRTRIFVRKDTNVQRVLALQLHAHCQSIRINKDRALARHAKLDFIVLKLRRSSALLDIIVLQII